MSTEDLQMLSTALILPFVVLCLAMIGMVLDVAQRARRAWHRRQRRRAATRRRKQPLA